MLYEFEACPFCRKVREALTRLDLDAEIRPCPRGGVRFRPELVARGGKAQFPYLVDPNAGLELYESGDIVRHLQSRYGAGPGPSAASTLGVALASALRGSAGRVARPAKQPEQLLELWGSEASPGARLVREELCELELPYRLHNLGSGSPRRGAFAARFGEGPLPVLWDPNQGRTLGASDDIPRYLRETYAA